jgi:hypothetical protein
MLQYYIILSKYNYFFLFVSYSFSFIRFVLFSFFFAHVYKNRKYCWEHTSTKTIICLTLNVHIWPRWLFQWVSISQTMTYFLWTHSWTNLISYNLPSRSPWTPSDLLVSAALARLLQRKKHWRSLFTFINNKFSF